MEKLQQLLAGGGCAPLAAILKTLRMSAAPVQSTTAVTVSTSSVALSAPLCGLILNLDSPDLKYPAQRHRRNPSGLSRKPLISQAANYAAEEGRANISK